MYFPQDMTFQYFFFDTYPGYFLQAVPIALIAGVIAFRSKRSQRVPASQAVCSALFVSYITGLISLTVALYVMSDIWYFLLYHAPSGHHTSWFTFEFYLIPDFFRHFGSEALGNILMYLPFGILYPLARRNRTWKQTVAAGVLTSLVIELVQPVFGRSFDLNDIILNTLGVLISAAAFHTLRLCLRKK